MERELSTLLKEAAPKPHHPPAPEAAQRRARRIRRVRRAGGVAGALTVAALALVVGPQLLTERVDTVLGPGPPPVPVTIFLSEDITVSERAAIEEELSADPAVVTYHYQHHSETYELFVEQYGDDPVLLETVTPEMLPSSFQVTTRDAAAADALIQQIKDMSGVDDAAAWDGTGPSTEAWRMFIDTPTGISLRHPDSWQVLAPPTVRGPDHVVTVVSPGVQRGSIEACQHDASAGWPVDGAVVRAYDDGAALPNAPARPERMELGDPTLAPCNYRVRGWQFSFAQNGRGVRVVVYLGQHATPVVEAEALAVLNTIEVTIE